MNNRSAVLQEIFSSIQGEGLQIGQRQIFIRFHGCDLSCTYCDTVEHTVPETCRVEMTPGRLDFHQFVNPISLQQLCHHLESWQQNWPRIHHSISLTGGEPLLHHVVLAEWLPFLQGYMPIYLETNGLHHQALVQVLPYIDTISMDIKIPSTSGYTDLWEQHRCFMQLAVATKLFIKIVIGDSTSDWEIIRACELVTSVDKQVPVILQPVTSTSGCPGISTIRMLHLQEVASQLLPHVRVIGQTHKSLGLL